MQNIIFHPDVHIEIQNAYTWYEPQSDGLGSDFINELESAYISIKQMPHAWPSLSKSIHRYILKKFPYGILYSIKDENIFIIAVMHLHRKPGYWEKRI